MDRINRSLNLVRIFKIFLIIVLLPVILIWIFIRKFKRKNKNSDEFVQIYSISQVDGLSGEDFEKLVKEIFEKQGYLVSLTKGSHDFGADLILSKGKKISVVQTKCYDKNVGIHAVQEIISAKKHYGAEETFVVINRYFSKEAIILATEYNVHLIDRDVLVKLIEQFKPNIKASHARYVATLEQERNKIETRYKYWI